MWIHVCRIETTFLCQFSSQMAASRSCGSMFCWKLQAFFGSNLAVEWVRHFDVAYVVTQDVVFIFWFEFSSQMAARI